MKILTFLFLSCSFQTIAQTCVIVVATNDSVIIGADSRVAQHGYILSSTGKTETYKYTQDCKIRTDKNVYYTGFGRGLQIIMQCGQSSIEKQTTFKDKISYLKSDAIKKLEVMLENIRKTDLPLYIRDYKKGFAAIIFVWYYNNRPKFWQFTFKNMDIDNKKAKVEVLEEEAVIREDNSMFTTAVGHTDAVALFLNNTNFWIDSKSFTRGIERLLEFQAKSTPTFVSAPFSIVKITKSGSSWYKRGVCK